MIDEEDLNFPIKIDMQEVIAKLPEYSMEKLCDIVICDRYLGFNQDLAVACMEELGRRRVLGDPFDFEDYIEREYKSLPKIDSSMPDLQTILTNAVGGFKI